MFVYHFCRCVNNNHEIVLWLKGRGVCGGLVVELEVVVIIWGDLRMKLPMREWDGPFKEKTLTNIFNFTQPMK